MRRPYSARRNVLIGRGTWVASAAALFVACLLLILRLVFPGALIIVVTPFWRWGNDLVVSVEHVSAGFSSAAKLADERDALAQQVAALSTQNAVLTTKITDLTKLLGSGAPAEQGVVAGVLARPPESPYDTLVVAAGSSAGVYRGDLAYVNGGVRIGVVDSLTANEARVTLLSAAGEVVNAWVGANRVPIRLLGEGGGSFGATVPIASNIAMGDVVYVAGPGALQIGVVKSVEHNQSSPSEMLRIASTVNILAVPWVLLVHAGPSSWPSGSPVATSTLP